MQRTKGKTRPGGAAGGRSKKSEPAAPVALYKSALAVAAISASVLAYESMLTRIFSLVFQYHFAFVAVSLAVFGLGVGALLAYISGWTTNLHEGRTRLVRLGLATAIALPLSTLLFSRLIASNLRIITFTISLAPFLLAGMFSAVLYAQQSRQGAAIYAADLGGAAVGLLFSLGLIGILGAFNAAFLSGCLAALGAIVLSSKRSEVISGATIIVLILALIGVNLKTNWIDLPSQLGNVPPDKVMFHVLADPSQGASSLDKLWSAFARVDLIKINDPDQMEVFTDAGAGSFMLRFDGDLSKVTWLAQQPGFLPFVSGPVNKVLILGSGAGKDIVEALLAGSKDITAVEINPAMVALTRRYASYNGGILDYPGVKTVVDDARNYVERSQDLFDLLYMNLVYAQAAQPANAALTESYSFTVEAFQAYWNRLTDNGMLAVVSHQALEGSRVLLTALAALQKEGMPTSEGLKHAALLMQPSDDPNQRLTVVMLKRSEWTPTETARLVNQATVLGMQPLFIPGRYEDTMKGLTDDKVTIKQFLTEPTWDLSPTYDDRPFFFNLSPGLPSAIIIMLGVSLAGILIFLLLTSLSSNRPQVSLLFYFFLSGISFLLLEMPIIQRGILILGNPTLATAVILGGLLVGAGIGSLISRKWSLEVLLRRVMWAALLAGLLALGMAWIEPLLVKMILPANLWIRSVILFLVVMLLAIPLGVPFSSGLRLLNSATPGKTALLWGWNASAAVLGSALAVALAMLAGFSWAIAGGAVCYLALALLVFWMDRKHFVW
jgi:hypothetical protein